ncbi:MAG: hypothetical protein ACI9FN_002698 [Saprospiraceae bacterium]|jgi:hypothetical protein
MLTQRRLENGELLSYAAGLIIDDYNGEKVVKHSGQNPGFSSEILRFPDHGISIIVLGNQNWHDVNFIASEVAEIFFPSPTKKEKIAPTSLVTSVPLSIHELNAFCANYHFKEQMNIEQLKG